MIVAKNKRADQALNISPHARLPEGLDETAGHCVSPNRPHAYKVPSGVETVSDAMLMVYEGLPELASDSINSTSSLLECIWDCMHTG